MLLFISFGIKFDCSSFWRLVRHHRSTVKVYGATSTPYLSFCLFYICVQGNNCTMAEWICRLENVAYVSPGVRRKYQEYHWLEFNSVWKPASQSYSSASHVCWTKTKFCLSPTSAPASAYFSEASGQMKKRMHQFQHNSKWEMLTSDKSIKDVDDLILCFFLLLFSVFQISLSSVLPS